ncbi:MAG: TerC family protein [Gammaproteobacteria bacterium]|nr:TerC family protein [Gammaproteobacteria bacterium]
MAWLTDPDVWASLVTLTALEIVLGVDNIIFISIASSRLEAGHQEPARRLGLAFAVVTRLALLGVVFWLSQLTAPLFTLFARQVSLRDLVMIGGGLFLIAKSTTEIHNDMQAVTGERRASRPAGFASVVAQIALLDMVFSFDSVITAIGMADHFLVMAAAIIIAIGCMLLWSGAVSRFVQRNPTIKMLALAFLILIGVALIADGVGLHIPKGYIYFAMAFAFAVELLNQRIRGRPAA